MKSIVVFFIGFHWFSFKDDDVYCVIHTELIVNFDVITNSVNIRESKSNLFGLPKKKHLNQIKLIKESTIECHSFVDDDDLIVDVNNVIFFSDYYYFLINQEFN